MKDRTIVVMVKEMEVVRRLQSSLRLWFGMLGRHGHELPLLWKLQNRKSVGHGRTRRRVVSKNGGSVAEAETNKNIL